MLQKKNSGVSKKAFIRSEDSFGIKASLLLTQSAISILHDHKTFFVFCHIVWMPNQDTASKYNSLSYW